MSDDYNRGLITGLAMQPLYVVSATQKYEGGDVICTDMVATVYEQIIIDDVICSSLSIN